VANLKGDDNLYFQRPFVSLDFDLMSNEKELEGRTSCSFCFKSHQNAYEGEKTKYIPDLHAEEKCNVMVKNGGLGLKGGNCLQLSCEIMF
jgi:hypothetical protein